MRLLGRADSLNVRKVLWAMDELELEATREDYGGPFGKTDTSEYRNMNPNGLVPTLVDGETVIWESNTVIRYIGHAVAKRSFIGQNASSVAKVSQWMDWQLGTLNPPLQTIFFQVGRMGDKRDVQIVEENKAAVHKLLNAVLASVLPPQGFLFGSSITAADVCIGVMLHRYVSLLGAQSLEGRVVRYHGQLAERPGFQKHVEIGKP